MLEKKLERDRNDIEEVADEYNIKVVSVGF